MDWFFEQWLLQPGYPQVEITWNQEASTGSLELMIEQVQQQEWGDYQFSLPVEVELDNGSVLHQVVRVTGREATHRMVVGGKPTELRFDPDETLLLEVAKVRRGG